MGLAESQRLLARLATEAPLRERFLADPPAVALEFGLSPGDLAGLPPGQLDEFARSLIGKRLRAVESLLPLTALALGPARFAASFRAHARAHVPLGIKKHRDDAAAFAGFLANRAEGPSWPSELARHEAAALLAHDPGRRLVAIRLRHHPADLARAATEGGPAPRPRPTWVAWFRVTRVGRIRRGVVSRPW